MHRGAKLVSKGQSSSKKQPCSAACRCPLYSDFAQYLKLLQASYGTVFDAQGGEAGGQAAIAELIKEATLLSSMRHPNVVWVYGIVLRSVKAVDDSDDEDNFLDGDTNDAVELAAALARQVPAGGAGVVRPPAIVVEYMGQGSLKGALARKADIVQGALIRVLIAMDAAKVCLSV